MHHKLSFYMLEVFSVQDFFYEVCPLFLLSAICPLVDASLMRLHTFGFVEKKQIWCYFYLHGNNKFGAVCLLSLMFFYT